jgi:MraZ protein
VDQTVLRGNFPAKIDDKSRLKIPTGFRALIEREYGRELFVTSLTGESVRVYPMSIWAEIERRLGDIASTEPARARFLARVNYFGQVAEIDNQGRVLIQPRLRESAQMAGEVDVLGQFDYLEVWNHERFIEKLARDPFTDDDARALAKYGI